MAAPEKIGSTVPVLLALFKISELVVVVIVDCVHPVEELATTCEMAGETTGEITEVAAALEVAD